MSSTTTLGISGKHSIADSNVQLSVDDVSVSFDVDTALKAVSFAIRRGEFIGLVGQNGSGKTTLLRVLLGLQKPDKGQAVRHKGVVIGYVPQRGNLYNGIVPISALEIVKLGSKGNAAIARQALLDVGMSEYESQSFSTLSGGQQQRIVIAKALASGADILLLDEPTTGIDEENQAEFYAMLQKLHGENRTILMVSHDIDSVVSIVSRVICLNRSIIYDGPPEHFSPDDHLRSGHHLHLHRGEGNV